MLVSRGSIASCAVSFLAAVSEQGMGRGGRSNRLPTSTSRGKGQ